MLLTFQSLHLHYTFSTSRTRFVTRGDWGFKTFGTKLWNSFPLVLGNPASCGILENNWRPGSSDKLLVSTLLSPVLISYCYFMLCPACFIVYTIALWSIVYHLSFFLPYMTMCLLWFCISGRHSVGLKTIKSAHWQIPKDQNKYKARSSGDRSHTVSSVNVRSHGQESQSSCILSGNKTKLNFLHQSPLILLTVEKVKRLPLSCCGAQIM